MNYIRLLIILLTGIGLIASCNSDNGKLPADVVHNPITASGEANMNELPAFEFREILHDFGTVIEGEKVTYSFKFKNSGGKDLLISNVSASCGCTATKYTKETVAPGGEGVITVTFDSRRRTGFQNKTLTVSANT
ncbi:MAG: DUF1573 domain-containing protein, partial [Bacteroidales bacterium]|nr:DUF1573 domain-containing protein [Bacteroidales bacterium]